jgi:hypothetical protein
VSFIALAVNNKSFRETENLWPQVNEGSPVDLSRFVEEAKDLDSPDLSAPGNVSRKVCSFYLVVSFAG